MSLPPSHWVVSGSILKHRYCRYQTYPFEDHLSSCRFSVDTGLCYFSPLYGSTSISFGLMACDFSQRGDCSDCSPIPCLCFSMCLFKILFSRRIGKVSLMFLICSSGTVRPKLTLQPLATFLCRAKGFGDMLQTFCSVTECHPRISPKGCLLRTLKYK